jgi:hypothetical protein
VQLVKHKIEEHEKNKDSSLNNIWIISQKYWIFEYFYYVQKQKLLNDFFTF